MLQMPAKYKINNQRTQWKHTIPLQPIGRRQAQYATVHPSLYKNILFRANITPLVKN